MTRIFFNKCAIILTGEKPEGQKFSISYNDVKRKGVNWLLEGLANANYPTEVYLWGADPAGILFLFKEQLTLIVAGGGLIRKPGGEVLFIYRKGKWDFPKGKPGDSEDIETTALREIEEECGIKDAEITSPLPDTYHIYSITENVFALKQCKWFYMRSYGNDPLILQTEEGITDARWVNLPFPDEIIEGAYLSIKELALWFQENYRCLPGR